MGYLENLEYFFRLNESDIEARRITSLYRKNYGLGDEVNFEHVIKHVTLENALTKELLDTLPENRWDTFSRCYSRLYIELPWLANTGSDDLSAELWRKLLKPGAKLLEIGSGAGRLIGQLSQFGFDCVATEISKGRGKEISNFSNVSWSVSDGINLSQFHRKDSFDYLISDQVIEHLHPDDIIVHCREAFEILKPKGSYFIRTPHRSVGPSDLSKVLSLDDAIFMHLHEYTYEELTKISHEAGFSEINAVIYIPGIRLVQSSRAFLFYMLAVDWIEGSFLKLRKSNRRKFRRLLRLGLVAPNIWIEMVK